MKFTYITLPWSLGTMYKDLIPYFITDSLKSAGILVHHDPLAGQTSDKILLLVLCKHNGYTVLH
jgi:hypothetical protein